MAKDRQQKFTDLRRLISPFESPWSIVNKFAEVNHIPIWHAKQYFPRYILKSNKDSTPGFGEITRWNFNNAYTYPEIILYMLTSIPKDVCKFHNISSMLTTPEITAFTSAFFLRYCPVCIELGYHSVFFQMFLFSSCPIHNVNLFDKCYKCNFQISYDLNDKQKTAYSCCNCEYKFWNRFYQKSGAQQERLMKLPIDVRDEFERVFFWLANLKECAILRPVFEVKPAALPLVSE